MKDTDTSDDGFRLAPDVEERFRTVLREELRAHSEARRRREAAPEKLLTKADVAEVLGCTPRHVGTLIAAGEIASIKVGRLRRIPPQSLRAFVRRQAEEGRR